jgi:DNA-binding CsgD family transcriptional regulator
MIQSDSPSVSDAPSNTSSHRLSEFSNAVALVYEAQINPMRASDAEQAVRRLLDADEIVMFYGNDESRGASRTVAASPHVVGAPAPFCRRSNGHTLWLDVADDDTAPVRLLIRRDPSRNAFNDDVLELLSLLRPHLRNAHYLGSLTQRDVFGWLASAHLAHSMVQGLLITDALGIIRWQNPAAREILAEADGLSSTDGRLRAGRSFETAQIETLTRNAAAGKPGVMLVCRPTEKHPCGLVFTPLKPEGAMPLSVRDAGHVVLVTINVMAREIRVITERLGALFGLTPAEERLGALLLGGCSLQDAARHSNKALPTIKTQLRGMLKKTGARNQAELVGIFLSLPSLL